MASREESVITIPIREQSEIIKNRRSNRKARINSAHAEVRAILHHTKTGKVNEVKIIEKQPNK